MEEHRQAIDFLNQTGSVNLRLNAVQVGFSASEIRYRCHFWS
jgi:hypothetical protein